MKRTPRSKIAQIAHFATGAGTHGGGKRRRNRKERQQAKRDLKESR
jgi:hypothetical protein